MSGTVWGNIYTVTRQFLEEESWGGLGHIAFAVCREAELQGHTVDRSTVTAVCLTSVFDERRYDGLYNISMSVDIEPTQGE